MPRMPTLEPSESSPEVNEIYSDFAHRMGFPEPPNFIKTQGHSLSTAKGTWGLVQNTLVGGELPRTLKEMIFVAISQDRNCRYCEAAHLACCRMLGVDSETLQLLVSRTEDLRPVKIRDIILFALKCSRNPQGLLNSDFDLLKQHGLKQSEIVEIIGMSALAVYANIIADATGMQSDDLFSRWDSGIDQ